MRIVVVTGGTKSTLITAYLSDKIRIAVAVGRRWPNRLSYVKKGEKEWCKERIMSPVDNTLWGTNI